MSSSLDDLREDAIRDEKAFGVTRLKDEFKMKPALGATPAFYYKNPYGRGENPCYKVADCVPLREIQTKAPTKRQLLARKISGTKSKLRSHYAKVSHKCSLMLEGDIFSLDCETTGLGDMAQIIELALCDKTGSTVYCQRFKPTVEIEKGAYETHGISLGELKGEPLWIDCIDELKDILTDKFIVIFNSSFDLRLIQQTNQAFKLGNAWVDKLNVSCAMELAVDAFGSTNSYGTKYH